MTWRAFLDEVADRAAARDPEFRPVLQYGHGATPEAIAWLERQLDCTLPVDLRELLLEHDGVYADGFHLWLVWSIEEMIRTNLELWREEGMLRTDLVAFAPAGVDGILFVFEKRSTAQTVFAWDPIPNERPTIAPSLRTLLEGWMLGRISV